MNKENDIKKQIKSEDEIDLRELARIFINRKWWFIGTFIVVLIAGLLFTFLNTPDYSSTSILKVKEDYYLDSISEYFPEEADSLKIGNLGDVSMELKSDEVLEEVISSLDFKIERAELNEAINISIDDKKEIITITTLHSNPEIVYRINEALLNVYEGRKNLEFEETYNSLIEKVDESLLNVYKEVEEISTRIENYIVDFNLKLIKEMENKIGSNIYFSGINYVSPILLNELNSKYLIYSDLEKLKYNLTENKELFINKMEILERPKVPTTAVDTNYKRNALISLFLAIILGIVVVFVANYFISSKEPK